MKQTDEEVKKALSHIGKFVQIICQDRKKNPSAIILGVNILLNGGIEYFISFTDYGRTGRACFARDEFEILKGQDNESD